MPLTGWWATPPIIAVWKVCDDAAVVERHLGRSSGVAPQIQFPRTVGEPAGNQEDQPRIGRVERTDPAVVLAGARKRKLHESQERKEKRPHQPDAFRPPRQAGDENQNGEEQKNESERAMRIPALLILEVGCAAAELLPERAGAGEEELDDDTQDESGNQPAICGTRERSHSGTPFDPPAAAHDVTSVVGYRRNMPRTRVSARLHVTGGTGYLGSELRRQAPHASWERAEIRDVAAVSSLLTRLRPAVVIHTAYRQDGPGAWEITVDGGENVARAAYDVGARLVHLSTDVVFDGRKGTPYVEDDVPIPVTEYGRAKAEAERRVLAAHPEALVVRTSLIVGGQGFPQSKHELAAGDPAMTFYEDEIRSPVQVADLASALLELAELDIAGVLHVAGADAVSRAELAELAVGHAVRRVLAPPGRPLDCTLDSARARRLLRTELRGVRSLLRPD